MKRLTCIHILIICTTLLLSGCAVASPISTKNQVGSGRVIKLYPDRSLSDQLTQRYTTYEVGTDFVLKGQVVAIPEGCTLVFNGGTLSNGTLVGSNTTILLKQESPVFDDVKLKGSFKAEEFPLNAYKSNKLDYFYSFLQAFSGTSLYLTDDYSVTEFLGESDCTIPTNLTIDGRGHKLTLYSFGAYMVKHCSIKDITIECRNNIAPKNRWKSDKFTFGIVGNESISTLELNNVSFTKECGYAYLRGFAKLDIANCTEEGSYFFVYDCENVNFNNNSIKNAANGYYSIGKQSASGQVRIHDNHFRNIKGGGIILTGGLKYNVSITNNILEKVGGGGATKACINIHPRGTINVSKNIIVANVGAVTLDIDAAGNGYFSDETVVTVEKNDIRSVSGDTSIHGMALVGLGKLYFRNNKIKDQLFYFWDTPYMEFTNNTVAFSKGFDKNTTIGKMSTHETTEKKTYNHIYKNNVFDIPYAKSYVKFEYLSKAPVQIKGVGNTYSTRVDFVDQYKKFKASGDIKIYK